MTLSTDDRRILAGLVAAGENEAEATQVLELANMAVNAALDRFKSIINASAASDRVKIYANVMAVHTLHEQISATLVVVEQLAEQSARAAGSEYVDILRRKASKAMHEFKG